MASLARTLLIVAAHSYRFSARIARHELAAIDAVPEAVRAIQNARTALVELLAASATAEAAVTLTHALAPFQNSR